MHSLINKSTAAFYGTYNYSTLIDHKMTSKNVQNSSGTTSRRRVVSLPSLRQLWRHVMVYKSIDHRKLPLICFLQ